MLPTLMKTARPLAASLQARHAQAQNRITRAVGVPQATPGKGQSWIA